MKNSFSEYSPCIDLHNKEKLRVLLHPAFPHIIMGILRLRHTKIEKILSSKALFFVVFFALLNIVFRSEELLFNDH